MRTLILLFTLLFNTVLLAQSSWYEVQVPTIKKLNAIDFPTPQVGYIAGDDSVLLKTTDGGQNWQNISFSGINFSTGNADFSRIQFVTENTGFATVGSYNSTYKTTDGGVSWSQLTVVGNLCYMQAIYFMDEENGFIGGSGCFEGEIINKFVNGTATDATINSSGWNQPSLIVDIDMNSTGSYGLAASSGGRILRTTDSGNTWDTIPSSLGNNIPLTSVTIVNDTLAFAGYNDSGSGLGLLRTTDAGLTWDMDMNSATFFYPAFYDVHAAGNGVVYSGAEASSLESGWIYESNNSGVWYTHSMDQSIYNITSYNDSVIWAVGDSGYVVTNVDPTTLGVDKKNNQKTDLKVYPNPVESLLHIQIPNDLIQKDLTLIIRDMNGRIIKRVSLREQLNVSNLSKGMYSLEIQDEKEIYMARFVVK